MTTMLRVILLSHFTQKIPAGNVEIFITGIVT